MVDVATGDVIGPYRTHADLNALLGQYGFQNDGLLTRRDFVLSAVVKLNGTPALKALILELTHPAEVKDVRQRVDVVAHLNHCLSYDGFEIVSGLRGAPVVRALSGSVVDFPDPLRGSNDDARQFLEEQREKCDQKIRDGDYDGAITNARSLLERILQDIEAALTKDGPEYDGDLLALFKRVQRMLNLEPGRPDLDTALKQTLVGLTSVVSGIAGTSNKMGDRHSRKYRPQARHAILVVDSAKTLAAFLVSTFRERESSGQ